MVPHGRAPAAAAMPLLALAFSAMVPLSAAQTPSSTATRNGVLTGLHFNVTVVNSPPFVDMGLVTAADGSVSMEEDPTRWTGYIPDMIALIAQSDRAGFTYTLKSPSGFGSHCSHPNGNAFTGSLADYASQYNCGQDDTIELGTTQAFWSMYYISKFRIQNALFTVPFLSDVGVEIVAPKQREDYWSNEHLFKLFEPFTGGLWLASIGLTLLVSLTVWMIEHSRKLAELGSNQHQDLQTVHTLALTSDSDEAVTSAVLARMDEMKERSVNSAGYMSYAAMYTIWPQIFSDTFHTLGTLNSNEMRSRRTIVVCIAWAFFSIVWLVGYTAQLSVVLYEPDVTYAAKSLEELVEKKLKACTKQNSAYSNFIAAAYPAVNFVYPTGAHFDLAMMQELEAGNCDVMIQPSIFGEALKNGAIDLDPTAAELYCSSKFKLGTPMQPLPWGLNDMAVGVSVDHPGLVEALDFWIHALRRCHTSERGGDCYLGYNLEDLYEKYVGSLDRCNAGGEDDTQALDIYVFLLPGAVVIVSCVFGFVSELYVMNKKGILRGLVYRDASKSIINVLRKQFKGAWVSDGTALDIKKFTDMWWEDSDAREKLFKPVEAHFTTTDVIAMNTFRTGRTHYLAEVARIGKKKKRLDKERRKSLPEVDESQEEHVSFENVSYCGIPSCQPGSEAARRVRAVLTVQMVLVQRAVAEALAKANAKRHSKMGQRTSYRIDSNGRRPSLDHHASESIHVVNNTGISPEIGLRSAGTPVKKTKKKKKQTKPSPPATDAEDSVL